MRIQNLNKTFRGRAGTVVALDGVSLDIRRGEIFGIIGLSGAGKSTLVRCINFLEKPTEGTVTVDGQELGALSKKELLQARRSMGMIFQQFNLLQTAQPRCKISAYPLEIAGTVRREAEKRARRTARYRRPERPRGQLPIPAFRRPAAARGHRASPGDQP